MGNLNYILSLPLILLALLDYEDLLRAPRGAWPVVRQCLWQAALAITHPFSLLVYVSLALVGSVLIRPKPAGFRGKVLGPLCVAFVLFLGCWVESMAPSSSEAPAPGGIDWISPKAALQFGALMFTGMQWTNGVDVLALALWGALLAVGVGTATVEWANCRRLSLLPVALLAAATLGFFVLPCRIGNYTGINLRIAPVAYFLLAMVLAQVRFGRWRLWVFVVLCGLCTLDSVARQARLLGGDRGASAAPAADSRKQPHSPASVRSRLRRTRPVLVRSSPPRPQLLSRGARWWIQPLSARRSTQPRALHTGAAATRPGRVHPSGVQLGGSLGGLPILSRARCAGGPCAIPGASLQPARGFRPVDGLRAESCVRRSSGAVEPVVSP